MHMKLPSSNTFKTLQSYCIGFNGMYALVKQDSTRIYKLVIGFCAIYILGNTECELLELNLSAKIIIMI